LSGASLGPEYRKLWAASAIEVCIDGLNDRCWRASDDVPDHETNTVIAGVFPVSEAIDSLDDIGAVQCRVAVRHALALDYRVRVMRAGRNKDLD